jgi:iron complex transport system substrate-binding protein
MRKSVRILMMILVTLTLAVLAEAAGSRITDLAGREVSTPDNPRKLVALVGPTSEKLLLLGAGDRVAGKNAYAVGGPWALEVYPRFKDVKLFQQPMSPNLEELIALEADIVYFWNVPDQIAKMEEAGLVVVVAQLVENNPSTIDEFIGFQKKEVSVIAQSIGADAIEKAKRWNDYFDAKVNLLRERTAGLSAAEKKKVYYSCADDPLECFSKNSYPQFAVELAGGTFVAAATAEEVDTVVTLEQVIAWDPDVIIMGRTDTTDGVLKDERWNEISAVKNGSVLLPPNGVMFWDYGSENVLLMQFIAKALHPDLFADIDMVKETKDYYRTFYGYELSDENAGNILSHMPPIGK